jgi:hypothetical protein
MSPGQIVASGTPQLAPGLFSGLLDCHCTHRTTHGTQHDTRHLTNTLAPSGGVDGSLHALPLSSLVQADKHPGLEMYAPLPPRPMVSFSASRGRFLYNGKPSVLEVWKAGQEVKGSLAIRASEQPGESGLPLPIADTPKLIAKLQLKVPPARPLPRTHPRATTHPALALFFPPSLFFFSLCSLCRLCVLRVCRRERRSSAARCRPTER